MTLLELWLGGFPVLGVIAGIAGVSFRRVRQVLVWSGAIWAAGIFVYGLFAGGPHNTAYISGLNSLGIGLVLLVTVLAAAPILAAVLGSRIPSVVATALLAVLVLSFTLGLAPWLPAAACVLAAAIAGPPDARKARGSR